MTAYKAYFDISGKSTDPDIGASVYVGGFVASEDKWQRFDREWAALLARNEITPPFHTTNFETRNKQFYSWRSDEGRREAVRLDILNVINRCTDKPFAVGLAVKGLADVFANYDINERADFRPEPAVWCAVHAYALMMQWVRRNVTKKRLHLDDTLTVTFEDGDEHKGILMRAITEQFSTAAVRVDVAFAKKGESPRFEAADFLVWHFRSWQQRREVHRSVGKYVKHATFIDELVRVLPHDALRIYDYRLLSKLCEQRKFRPRPDRLVQTFTPEHSAQLAKILRVAKRRMT